MKNCTNVRAKKDGFHFSKIRLHLTAGIKNLVAESSRSMISLQAASIILKEQGIEVIKLVEQIKIVSLLGIVFPKIYPRYFSGNHPEFGEIKLHRPFFFIAQPRVKISVGEKNYEIWKIGSEKINPNADIVSSVYEGSTQIGMIRKKNLTINESDQYKSEFDHDIVPEIASLFLTIADYFFHQTSVMGNGSSLEFNYASSEKTTSIIYLKEKKFDPMWQPKQVH
jgi:hypothetical protein